MDAADSGMSNGEFALPAGVGGVGRGEALVDDDVFAKSGQRLVEAALLPVDVADTGMGDGDFALPAGVGGVGRGEASVDDEVFAESGQRLVEAALLPVEVADSGMSVGEFALPASVGGVGCGEASVDDEVFAESGQRLVEAAFCLQDIAEKTLCTGNPGRNGRAAGNFHEFARLGLELGAGFSARVAELKRRQPCLDLGRSGKPAGSGQFPEGQGARMADLGASANGEFQVQRGTFLCGGGLVDGEEVVECLYARVAWAAWARARADSACQSGALAVRRCSRRARRALSCTLIACFPRAGKGSITVSALN
jgi:hypothetical protein